jgi:hypothetical protein
MTLLLALLEDRRLGLALLGALALVGGSIAPWIHVPQPLVGTLTGSGIAEDGKITVLLGAMALACVLAHAVLRARDLVLAAAASGLAAAAVAGLYLSDLGHHAARLVARELLGAAGPVDPASLAEFPARAGVGPWIVIAGAAVLVVAAMSLSLREDETIGPARRASG